MDGGGVNLNDLHIGAKLELCVDAFLLSNNKRDGADLSAEPWGFDTDLVDPGLEFRDVVLPGAIALELVGVASPGVDDGDRRTRHSRIAGITDPAQDGSRRRRLSSGKGQGRQQSQSHCDHT